MNSPLPHSKNILRTNIVQTIASVLMIFALLFSFVSHSEHYDLATDVSEQHCHLCQYSIDKVDNDLSVNTHQLSQYLAYTAVIYNITPVANFYLSPPLRAPPVQL